MKKSYNKIKKLSILATLGAIFTTASIVITSCSNNKLEQPKPKENQEDEPIDPENHEDQNGSGNLQTPKDEPGENSDPEEKEKQEIKPSENSNPGETPKETPEEVDDPTTGKDSDKPKDGENSGDFEGKKDPTEQEKPAEEEQPTTTSKAPDVHVKFTANKGGKVVVTIGEEEMKPRQGYEDDIKGLTRISVKAVPDEGYVFIGWNDGGTDNPRIIEKLNIRNNKLTANFEWQQTPPVEQETNEEPDVVAKNTMVYNNETIKLADNINPNCFCWKSDATGEMIKTANPSKMTLKQINGELLDIPWSDANKITSINVTDWDKNVETLNDNFLWFCKNLKEINLDFLSKIKKIGHNFLCYCESLKQIDLSKLTLLESIGDNFLYGEQSLNNLTISGFTSLKTIGESFLAKCHNVYKLDLGSLFKVETIGNNFLWEAHLSTIDMSKMSSLKYIGDSFLRDCSRLDKLYLPIPKGTDSVPELKSLGDGPKWNYVTIYCGSWLDKYQKADVWSTRASQMVDGTKQKQESN